MLRLHNTQLTQCCYAANAYEGLTYNLSGLMQKEAEIARNLYEPKNLTPIAAKIPEDLAWQSPES